MARLAARASLLLTHPWFVVGAQTRDNSNLASHVRERMAVAVVGSLQAAGGCAAILLAVYCESAIISMRPMRESAVSFVVPPSPQLAAAQHLGSSAGGSAVPWLAVYCESAIVATHPCVRAPYLLSFSVSRSWWLRSTFARQLVAAQYFGSACIASLLLLPRVPCVRAPHLSSFHRLPQLVAAQYLGSACIASLLLWPCIPFVRAPYLSSFHRLPQLVAARYLGLPCRVILLSNAG